MPKKAEKTFKNCNLAREGGTGIELDKHYQDQAYRVAHRSTVQLKHKACDQRSTTTRLYDHATLATETEGNVKESSKRNADKLPKTETDLQLVILQESVIETILTI